MKLAKHPLDLDPPEKREPTLEEIYGTPDTIGLAEQCRTRRELYHAKEVELKMLPFGFGKLLGQSSGG